MFRLLCFLKACFPASTTGSQHHLGEHQGVDQHPSRQLRDQPGDSVIRTVQLLTGLLQHRCIQMSMLIVDATDMNKEVGADTTDTGEAVEDGNYYNVAVGKVENYTVNILFDII